MCKLETDERSPGEWTCLLLILDNSGNITDEKSVELDYAEVATVAASPRTTTTSESLPSSGESRS